MKIFLQLPLLLIMLSVCLLRCGVSEQEQYDNPNWSGKAETANISGKWEENGKMWIIAGSIGSNESATTSVEFKDPGISRSFNCTDSNCGDADKKYLVELELSREPDVANPHDPNFKVDLGKYECATLDQDPWANFPLSIYSSKGKYAGMYNFYDKLTEREPDEIQGDKAIYQVQLKIRCESKVWNDAGKLNISFSASEERAFTLRLRQM